MSDPLELVPRDQQDLLQNAPPPERADVMKAVLTEERFSDPAWIFERKLDGIRCLAIRSGGSVRLFSRNSLSMNERFPELARSLGAQRRRFAVDGEVVAFEGSTTSFAKLAQRGRRPVRVYLYVFDLLWLEGQDVRPLPLLTRKRLLRSALTFADGVRLTPYRKEIGEELFGEACRKGWEGLIAKRADSPYVANRSRDWLKFKCAQGQEMVIGGYTAPRGSRTEFGALLLGYYDGEVLRYAGKVGTGFDHDTLRELGAKLRAIGRDRSPFARADPIKERDVSWVEPSLVAQIGYSEWTSYGRLRHPRFLGLREDKSPREVVRERIP